MTPFHRLCAGALRPLPSPPPGLFALLVLLASALRGCA